jgi:hypothetical protein
MLDIKSGVLMLGVITTLMLVIPTFNDHKYNDLKNEMENMRTQMELMKELHSNTKETLELDTSNRLR